MQALRIARTFPRLPRHRIYRPLVLRHARLLTTKPPEPPRPPPSKPSETATASSSNAQPPEHTPAPETAPPSPTSLSLDFAAGKEEQPQRTGARSSKDSLSSIERRRRVMSRFALGMLGLGLVGAAIYSGREWEPGELRERKISPETAPTTWFGRMRSRFISLFDFFNKPTWEELLPPPIPQYQKPYTLLLSIDDLLVTSTWDRVNGWRTAKRPGVDYFLAYLSQFYEIVIFTSQHHYTAIPVIEKLDPYNFFITYKLFRESTRSVDGEIKKDLTYLNRDLSKVILMDTDPEHVTLQPENAIIVPKWKGDPSDKGLVAMIPFLESIAIYKPQDVRPILKKYQGLNIPIEYAKVEAEQKRRFIEEWQKGGKAKPTSFTLSSLFGGSSQDAQSPEPLTYLEQKRLEAQRHYLEEQKYIRDNKENFDRLLEEDRKAQEAQMSGSMWNVLKMVTGAQPPPGPEAPQSAQGSPTTGSAGASPASASTPPTASSSSSSTNSS